MSGDIKPSKLCNVEGCESETKLNESVSYYTLPPKPALRQKWYKALGLDATISQFIVCSGHFTENDFASQSRAGAIMFRHLKNGAVPSLNLPVSGEFNYEVQLLKMEPDANVNEPNIDLISNVVKKKTVITSPLKKEVEYKHIMPKEENVLQSGTDSAEEKEQSMSQDESQDPGYYLNGDMDTQYAILQQGEDGVMYQLITGESQLQMFEDGQYMIQYDDGSQSMTSMLEQSADAEATDGQQEKVVKKRGRGRKRNEEVLEHFDITVLTLDEQIAEIQNRALTSNYINAAYKCNLCYKGYMTENTYNTHMDKHGEQSGAFQCVVCQRRCNTQLSLKSHMLNHVYKYTCKICDYCARNKAGAELHMNWHNGTVYQCVLCEQSFQRVSTLMTHVRIKHPSDYVCGLCGYSFIGQKGLSYHRKLKHRLDDRPIPEDGPTCETCSVQFVSEEALDRHVKVSPKHIEVPNKERNEPPQPKGLRRIRNRTSKKRIERNPNEFITASEEKDEDDEDDPQVNKTTKFVEPIQCELCGESVSSPREYHLHYKRVHPAHTRTHFPQMKHPQLCQYCGRVFTCAATLKDHLLKHTGSATFTCSECGNQYHTMSSLQNHLRIHLGPRFPCPLCGKMFNQQSNRDRHFNYVHSDLRTVECEHCHKLFKNNEDRTLHVNHVHLRKPWPKRIRNRNTERKRRMEGDPEIIKIPIFGLETNIDGHSNIQTQSIIKHESIVKHDSGTET